MGEKHRGRSSFGLRSGPLFPAGGLRPPLPLLVVLAAFGLFFPQSRPSSQRKTIQASESGHTDAVTTVAFSPDGHWLASASADKTVRLWEVETGREVHVLTGHTSVVESVAFSPDSRWVASASIDNTARVWEVSTGREARVLPNKEYVVTVAFSRDGRLLATACGFRVAEGGCKDPTIKLWDFATGEILHSLSGHRVGVRAVAFSPDGGLLASTGEDSTVRLWELGSGREVRVIPVAAGEATALAFNPDGRWVAGQSNQVVHVWEAATGRELHSLRQPRGGGGVAFSPDGHWLASTGFKPHLTLWDVRRWVPAHRVFDADFPFNGVAFSPDGRFLGVAGGDNTVKLFDATSLRLVRSFGQPGPYID